MTQKQMLINYTDTQIKEYLFIQMLYWSISTLKSVTPRNSVQQNSTCLGQATTLELTWTNYGSLSTRLHLELIMVFLKYNQNVICYFTAQQNLHPKYCNYR